jgi:hypothetical protein
LRLLGPGLKLKAVDAHQDRLKRPESLVGLAFDGAQFVA